MLRKAKKAMCGAMMLVVCLLVAGQCQGSVPMIIERQELNVNLTGLANVNVNSSDNGNFVSGGDITATKSILNWHIRRPGLNSTYDSTSFVSPGNETAILAAYDRKELSCVLVATPSFAVLLKINFTTLITNNFTILVQNIGPNFTIQQLRLLAQTLDVQVNQNCQLIRFQAIVGKVQFGTTNVPLVQNIPTNPTFSDNLQHVISNSNNSINATETLFSYNPLTNSYILATTIKKAAMYVIKSSPTIVFVLGITNKTMSNMTVFEYDLTILNIISAYFKVFQRTVQGTQTTAFKIIATPTLKQITFVYQDINSKTQILDLKTEIPSPTQMVMTLGQQTYLNLISSLFTGAMLLQSRQYNVILSKNMNKLTAYSYFNSQNQRIQYRNDINPFSINGPIYIDQTNQTFLEIIASTVSSTTLNVKSYNFGNFNSTLRAKNPLIFNLTSDALSVVTPNIFQWSFTTGLVSSNTQSLVVDRANCSNTSPINPMNPIDTICKLSPMVALRQMINVTTSTLLLLATNIKCKLVGLLSNNSIQSFYFNQSTNQYQPFAVSLSFNQTINLTQQWAVSQNCDRIIHQRIPFYNFNGTYMRTNAQNFSLMAVDANILWGATNTNIYKYDQNVNSFLKVNPGFNKMASKISIKTSQTNLLLISQISSSNISRTLTIEAFSYNFQTKTLANVFEFSYVYDNTTVSQVGFVTSTNINFLLIIPKMGGNYAAFRLIYSLRKGFQIMLPSQFKSYSLQSNFSLSDGFLTLRFDNLTMNNLLYLESIIYEYDPFTKSYVFKNAQAFSMLDSAVFKRFVPQTNSSHLQLYSQSRLSQTTIQIKQTLVQRTNSFEHMNGRILINNLMYRCSVDCLTCSSTTMCSLCTVNSYLASDKTCGKCGNSCFTCNQNNRAVCLSCAVGSFLSISICLKCNSVCLSCAESANNCIGCPTKHYLTVANSCAPCNDANCAMCSLLGVNCTMCIEGFTPFTTGTCIACFGGCSMCAVPDISICLGCSLGYFMTSDKRCDNCPSSCLTCFNANVCLTCDRGYHLSALQMCVKDCDYPCLTCDDNNSALCRTCFGSGILVNATCVQDIACNTTMNCLGCQGLNYLANGLCLKCTTVAVNCLKCNPLNSSQCILCVTGFFASNVGCSICDQGCKECFGSLMCKLCSDKYVLHSSLLADQCLPCVSPCLTCFVTPTQCLSCIEGYIQIGIFCIANTSLGFKMVFRGQNADPLFVLSQVSSVGGTNQSEIIVRNISLGSTIVNGIFQAMNATIAQSISNSINQSLNDPTKNLISAQFGNVQTFVPTGQRNKLSTLAIILLSVLIPLGLIAIILGLYCCFCKIQQQQQQQQNNQIKDTYPTKYQKAPLSDVQLIQRQ